MTCFADTQGFLEQFLHRWGTETLSVLVSVAVSFVLGRWWGAYRARKKWEKKEFFDRVNIGINILSDGWLKIRTICERSLDEVFLNPAAIDKIRDASQRTTGDNPLLPMPKEDCWFLLNFVLNAVAEHFAANLVRVDAGENMRPIAYRLCLTCEVVDADRIKKVRAMLIREDYLLDFPYKDSMPQLESPYHEGRVHTLRRLSELYHSKQECFMRLELYV